MLKPSFMWLLLVPGRDENPAGGDRRQGAPPVLPPMPSSCNRLAMMARLAGRIALVLGSVLIVLLALELTLRAWPTLLGHAFANGALSRYTSRAGGIYYADRGLRMSFMIPNHSATMLANGYVWRHRTDALGFRNDTLHVPADIMLLGDSIVYGHGVDFEHT